MGNKNFRDTISQQRLAAVAGVRRARLKTVQ
jgi:hypothetical protein